MPGYTHLQRAQPVYLGHHLLAYVWMFLRDRERFDAVIERVRGAAARRGRAGRRQLRHRPRAGRGASSASRASPPNSIDAVSNRDFALDYLAAAATAATHLSRLGAELVLWSSEEFGFCALARRLELGLLDHAAEEEPRRRRAAARQGAADRRPPCARCTASCTACR